MSQAPSPACSRAAPGIERHGGAFAHRGADQAVSGPGRQRPRRFPAREQRAALHHRAEWRRQDHLHQHDLGPPQAERRRHLVPGRATSPRCPSPPAPSGASAASSRRRACSTICRCSRTSSWRCSPPRGGQDASARIAQRADAWSGSSTRRASSPATSRTASASGWRSGFCSRMMPSFCCSTSRPPGMTAEETSATGELIRQLVAELQVAAIIIEHDINFIRSLRAPITVMHLGRVLVEGAFDEIEREPSRCARSISAARHDPRGRQRHCRATARSPCCATVSMQVGSGRDPGRARPQRHGQDRR